MPALQSANEREALRCQPGISKGRGGQRHLPNASTELGAYLAQLGESVMKLQQGENLIHELRPETRVLGIWFFTKCLPAVFVGAFLCLWCFAFFGIMFSTSKPSDTPWPIAVGGVTALILAPVILFLALVYCQFLRKTYVYYVTDQRCVFHGGILRRVERSVHYHKVTDVEMSQNIVERVLGISSLRIFTPGTGSMMMSPFGGQKAEIVFAGLKDNEAPAETINEILKEFRATGE